MSDLKDEYLKVNKLCHSYVKGKNITRVLQNISFKIKKGEMAALVGPSGSGKSTLLNLIGLLEDVNSGEIFLDKKLINKS